MHALSPAQNPKLQTDKNSKHWLNFKVSSQIILSLFPSVSHIENKFPTVKCNSSFPWCTELASGMWRAVVLASWDAASALYSATPTATTAASRTFIWTISNRYANEFIQQQSNSTSKYKQAFSVA